MPLQPEKSEVPTRTLLKCLVSRFVAVHMMVKTIAAVIFLTVSSASASLTAEQKARQVSWEKQEWDWYQLVPPKAKRLLPMMWNGERNVDAVELFAGVAMFTAVVEESGRKCIPYDIKLNRRFMNFNTSIGFTYALALVLSIKATGCLMAAPKCSNYVWINRGTSRRSRNNPKGDTNRRDVRDSNQTAGLLAILMKIAYKRGVKWIVEQPSSSLFWLMKSVRQSITECGAHHCFCWMGAFGNDIPKPTILYHTLEKWTMTKNLTAKKPTVSSSTRIQYHKKVYCTYTCAVQGSSLVRFLDKGIVLYIVLVCRIVEMMT